MDAIEETTKHKLPNSLINELDQAIEIVCGLDDRAYSDQPGGESSIGAHIRHNLEFVNELLNGIAERRVDYNARRRDVRIETDREYAIEQISFACRRLDTLTFELLEKLLVVRSEIDLEIWHTSSVSREIEFLHSHTVHHYALVARLIAKAGIQTGSGFGVAPSTRRFRTAATNYHSQIAGS